MPFTAAATLVIPNTTIDTVAVPTATGTTLIWTSWNQDLGSTIVGVDTAVTGESDTTVIWKVWANSYTTSTIIPANQQTVGETQIYQAGTIAATTDTIWTLWNADGRIRQIPGQPLTDAQREERRRHEIEYQARQSILNQETERAKARAEKLLQDSLDAKQREELARNGYFELDVISKNGERRTYRIHRKWSGNIQQINPSNGQRVKTLCIHPRETVPVADSMLAQKLMLESGMEEELLRIANHS